MRLVGDVGEFPLIEELTRSLRFSSTSGVEVGPGDDAAVLVPHPGTRIVATADLLVEGVHFTTATPAFFTGWRALAASLSDLAAMGARARWYLVTMALSPAFPVERVIEFYSGLQALADLHDAALVGGDVTSSPGPAMFDVLALGELDEEPPLRRSTAEVGDWVICTGHPGDSGAGLALLLAAQSHNPSLAGWSSGKEVPNGDGTWTARLDTYGRACVDSLDVAEEKRRALFREALGRFLAPATRLEEIGRLRKSLRLRAVDDISDGVASEANEVARASGADLVLNASVLPISAAARAVGQFLNMDPERWFLTGGEDYELLATCAPLPGYALDYRGPLSEVGTDRGGQEIAVTVIGQVEPSRDGTPGVWLVTGETRKPLPATGYAHFRGQNAGGGG